MIRRNLKISDEHDASTFYIRMTLINHMKMNGIVKRSIYQYGTVFYRMRQVCDTPTI